VRPILVRAFSIVNIHLIRERAAFRSRSQAAISDSRRAPAEIDMQRYFKVSPPSVHQMVLTLEREGFISRQLGVARSIEMLIEPERLPLLR
jgi:hypothetical protein